MKKLLCFLLTLLLFLTACSAQTPTATIENTINTEDVTTTGYLPLDLLGMTPAQLIELFGPNYREVVPEGDPPYFCFDEKSPYHFCGSIDDPQITYIQAKEDGSGVFPGLCIGDSLAALESWASENQELTYTPADAWYEGTNGEYGWVFLIGNGYHYSFYIENNVIRSFECWLEIS